MKTKITLMDIENDSYDPVGPYIWSRDHAKTFPHLIFVFNNDPATIWTTNYIGKTVSSNVDLVDHLSGNIIDSLEWIDLVEYISLEDDKLSIMSFKTTIERDYILKDFKIWEKYYEYTKTDT